MGPRSVCAAAWAPFGRARGDDLPGPPGAGSASASENPVKVRTFIIIAMFIVVVALLVSTGLIGAGVCVKRLGCASASAHAAALSRTNQVTIRTP